MVEVSDRQLHLPQSPSLSQSAGTFRFLPRDVGINLEYPFWPSGD